MKRHLIIATAAAAALLAGGTVTAVAANSDSGSGGARSSAQQTAHTAPSGPGTAQVQDGRSSIRMADGNDGQGDSREAKAAKVTAPDAAAAALKAVPGTVTGLDLDADRPGLVWDAEVFGKDGTQHEVTLDAGTARVLNQHVDRGDDDDRGRQRAALDNARTTAADAARSAAPRGTVTSVELDDDHGPKPAWEVETVTKDGKEHTVLVDPQSGKLTAAPAQDADDNDDDGSDD
ncbi:PepSY domain-containing protein [Streptomyces sioyaensis]|uniref:PepSY domain-containing protein n=1 Tax=Streptomyces sioyaensis TaxID=67364 RepID=UPI003D71F046